MKKHIFGFMLFSLIVGTSAFIYGFFFAPLTAIQPVYVFENQPEKRKSCRKETYSRVERPTVNAKVVQAVFNQNTNQVDMDLFLERKNNSTDDIAVWLEFFVKEGAKTRYLATEKVNLTPDFNLDDKATHSITSSYEWLDNLESRENLYVVPRTNGNTERGFTPIFDEAKATSVITLSRR
ncbi:MAG: hypothetical protein M3Q33_03515 [Acidobacteriota bacterium]|nr:hypothetical protein [Acidobacteriota bacterium]